MTKKEILLKQRNAENAPLTDYISTDGYVWKMIENAMEEYYQFMNIDKTSLENESQPSCLGAVISSFNTKHKRMVKVISGDDVFKGEITAMSWDIDQWTFMVDGEWYCQSEISRLQHPKGCAIIKQKK